MGPILFLCYINDIHCCTSLFTTLFADDGTCLSKHKDLNILIEFVNAELQKIANWFLSNKMAVNTTKTKFIIFRTLGKKIDLNHQPVVFNSNEIGSANDPQNIFLIERIHNGGETKVFKLLGVILDEYLSFEAHISMLCSKISKSLYIINRSKNFLPRESLLTLYFTLVHSHLSYCASIYGCASKTILNKLILKQKQAVRIIDKSNYRAHTQQIFKKLKILPLDQLIKYSQLKFMHSFHFGSTPLSFVDTWVTNRSRNPLANLRNSKDLYISAHNFTSILRLPLFAFPRVWNEETNHKENPNAKQYLKSLKNRIFENLT